MPSDERRSTRDLAAQTDEMPALANFYRRISGFCTTLIDGRDEFEGDIDRFLVYLIVLLDDLARASQRTRSGGVGVSALSIAEITGIPRETVRRKVALLVARNLITREGHAHYHISAPQSTANFVGRLSILFGTQEQHIARTDHHHQSR
jgi:hypothetical protein